jgi:hypothetical protein
VEKQENVVNFYNGKAKYSIEAGLYYTGSNFLLTKQKERGKVIVYTDCQILTKNKAKDIRKRTRLLAKRKYFSRAIEFLELAKETAKKNDILLTIG